MKKGVILALVVLFRGMTTANPLAPLRVVKFGNACYIVILTAILSSIHLFVSAQITLSYTACLNTRVDLPAPANNTYYSWQLNTAAANVSTLPTSVASLNATVYWVVFKRIQGNLNV